MTEPSAIEVSAEATSHKGEFFLIDAGVLENGRVPGIEIANEGKLIDPGMNVVARPDGMPGQYPERPHLVHVPAKGAMPRDLEELAGIWIVSEPLKQLFEQLDAEAFAFVACDFSLADGSPAPPYYLGNVLRRLDALDEASSRVRIMLDHNYQTGENPTSPAYGCAMSPIFRAGPPGPECKPPAWSIRAAGCPTSRSRCRR
ncbi:imm11 family protein [Achromobacter xylosoxidans]|uniref:imm11 family protein n=1 Tax=Alcaligenes xylosoxydans xylosoxydans TaxID=85698 RepID=UPI001F136129|nr:DUF1629 domain-containing protein [Achromobacter xylosoxidans]